MSLLPQPLDRWFSEVSFRYLIFKNLKYLLSLPHGVLHVGVLHVVFVAVWRNQVLVTNYFD